MSISRRPLIAGNWKMHFGVAATSNFLEDLLREMPVGPVDVLVCPPFTSLPTAAMLLAGTDVGLGAQNVAWAESGALTGEVAAAMLLEMGVAWVIVGHSERRTLFGETDDSAARRARAAQAAGLQVIFCIGESRLERETGDTMAVVQRQLGAVEGLDPDLLTVAYEPVWAIGTGLNATPAQAQEVHAFVRDRLEVAFGGAAAERMRLLYGGSLNPANAADILGQADVDGGLVGGASLDVASFSAIIRAAAVRR